jgi:glutathione S-transferase
MRSFGAAFFNDRHGSMLSINVFRSRRKQGETRVRARLDAKLVDGPSFLVGEALSRADLSVASLLANFAGVEESS